MLERDVSLPSAPVADGEISWRPDSPNVKKRFSRSTSFLGTSCLSSWSLSERGRLHQHKLHVGEGRPVEIAGEDEVEDAAEEGEAPGVQVAGEVEAVQEATKVKTGHGRIRIRQVGRITTARGGTTRRWRGRELGRRHDAWSIVNLPNMYRKILGLLPCRLGGGVVMSRCEFEDAPVTRRDTRLFLSSLHVMSENSPTSPRVNSAHLSKYPGRTVRLPCKVISVSVLAADNPRTVPAEPLFAQKQGDSALVEASDGVQVQVKLTPVRSS